MFLYFIYVFSILSFTTLILSVTFSSLILFSEVIKVYDGNQSLRRRIFRTVSLGRTTSVEECLRSALAAFHLADRRPAAYRLTDALHPDEQPLQDPVPLQRLTRRDNKRPAIFLRFRYDLLNFICCA